MLRVSCSGVSCSLASLVCEQETLILSPPTLQHACLKEPPGGLGTHTGTQVGTHIGLCGTGNRTQGETLLSIRTRGALQGTSGRERGGERERETIKPP